MKCYFCKTEMENVCPNCGAYRVTPETVQLKLKDQPYYKENKK